MGLAASQARLLLLTARKSDLEYRAQMICQRKVMLAMQTEELALNYSNALNNRALFFTYDASGNTGETSSELLTYDNFTAKANGTNYRLVTGEGKILARSLEEANDKYREDGDPLFTQDDILILPAATSNPAYLQDLIQSGKLIIEQKTETHYYKYGEKNYTEAELKAQLEADNEKDNEDQIKDKLKEAKKNTVTKTSWESKALSGMTDVKSRLDDTDDAAASATYEYQSLIVQNQDKQLDVELKQVETQQKACDNEIDSVKKILDKNIEKSFKTFA